MSKSNAICMLLFGGGLYLAGACLSAYTHRQFITKYNYDIKLVVMVDENMFKYKQELNKYFDEVILIDFIEVKLNPKYHVIEKYSKWMKYLINKWQILKLVEYEKILFIDIDILPIKKNFYEIFKNKTPGFLSQGVLKNNIEIQPEDMSTVKSNDFTMEKCYYFSNNLTKSIDAGFVLLEPNLDLYKEYFSFVKECAGEQGYLSLHSSGVDETTLLIFFMFYKKIPVYSISYQFAVIPWENLKYDKNDIRGVNFLSLYKPWTLLPMLQWGEQNIWHKIGKKALVKSDIITEFYVKNLVLNLENLVNNYKKITKRKNCPYNLEGINKNKNIFEKIIILLKNPSNNIKEIMDLSKEIHKYMNKYSIINYDELENLLDIK